MFSIDTIGICVCMGFGEGGRGEEDNYIIK